MGRTLRPQREVVKATDGTAVAHPPGFGTIPLCLGGGQCLSLADYVAMPGAHRRGPIMAIAARRP